MSLKSAIFIFPLVTLCVFCMQTSCVMCNFTSTLLDKLSVCVVSCWCTLHVVCVYKNDLMSCAFYTKLPSPRTLRVNALRKCMFHACYPKSIPIHLEWHSCGVVHVASSCIFHVIFHLENF
jgi:hypothetical protein